MFYNINGKMVLGLIKKVLVVIAFALALPVVFKVLSLVGVTVPLFSINPFLKSLGLSESIITLLNYLGFGYMLGFLIGMFADNLDSPVLRPFLLVGIVSAILGFNYYGGFLPITYPIFGLSGEMLMGLGVGLLLAIVIEVVL